ncbi:cell death protein 3-like protein [Dinothrombium tinctorium]|uniref:Cell death protein 3-like protein n=1 Tax=Dinothrombium tinctorium TaxID=1965070 RepID=A0A443QG27_9ACAR|nr:cell death protein 3-like protein [Dinothrombium tinctorium]
MKRAFKTLGFQVDLHRDLTATAMFDLLQDYASKTDELDKHDALAVVIFTHGESDFLYGVDGNVKIDRGVQRTVFDSRPDNFRAGQDVHKVTNYSVKPRIASFEDMLISYATIVEHASVHHNTDNGSWYGHSLSFHLLQSAHEKDLLEILKDVEKSVRLEETFEGHKQTTCYENRGFSKKLFFNPNFYD